MSEEQAEKIAKEYVLKYKTEFAKGKRRVTQREINAAVQTVAKEIRSIRVARSASSSGQRNQFFDRPQRGLRQ